MTKERADFRALGASLERRVLDQRGVTDAALRRRMAERAAGGPAIAEPFDDLARQIGEAAHRVTDAQVARVKEAGGSERAAFELIAAAAVGAGLLRWKAALAAIDEATR